MQKSSGSGLWFTRIVGVMQVDEGYKKQRGFVVSNITKVSARDLERVTKLSGRREVLWSERLLHGVQGGGGMYGVG